MSQRVIVCDTRKEERIGIFFRRVLYRGENTVEWLKVVLGLNTERIKMYLGKAKYTVP